MPHINCKKVAISAFMLAYVCLIGWSDVSGQTVNPLDGFSLNSTVEYPAGSEPRGMVTGDFNRDGKSDLAVVNRHSETVSILLGDGAGAFAAPRNFPTGREPFAIAIGDFNNDAKSDLIVIDSLIRMVSVLLGDGAGNFGAPANVNAVQDPGLVAVGDFNNDGKSDLAVGHSGFNRTGISILLGQGNGNFNSAINFVAGLSPRFIAVGDFNNDGKSDLAVAHVSSGVGKVSILLGDGTGNFGAPTDLNVGSTPSGITPADFNKDGKTDLAVANTESHNVSILLGNGAGGFGPATNFAAGTFPLTIAVGDFNNDGKDDLAVGGDNFGNTPPAPIAILLGDNAGGFGSLSFFIVGAGSFYVVSKDWNMDGKDDLAVANGGSNNVSVILNPFPSVSISDATVTEGNSGESSANFAVTLSVPTNLPVHLPYSVTNGTTTNADYDLSAASGTLTIPAGQTTGTITLPIRVDTTFESDETFFVDITTPYNTLIADGQGVGTILNDDPQPSITINDLSFPESSTGTLIANFTARLSNRSDRTITVNYTTADGTALAGSDYVATSGSLTFNPGQFSKSFTVEVNGDTVDEPDETFFVNLSGAVNATIADTQGVGTLLNDDNVVRFSQASYTVSEGAGFLNITISRDGTTSVPATIKYTTGDSTDANFRCDPSTAGQPTSVASRKCDYHIAVGTLRFAAGEATKQFTLSLVDDVYVEGSENLTLTLSNPFGVSLGQNSNVTVTITDNDQAGAANPIDQTGFFVRQLYVDLLSREPDPAGLSGWTTRIDQCGRPGQPPPPCDRVTVGGDGFLRSGEFFDRQFFVLRLYRTGLGRILRYDEVADLAYVSGFLTAEQLERNKRDLVSEMVLRGEFAARYNQLSNAAFVTTLLQTAGVSVPRSVQDDWIALLDIFRMTRAEVFREISERPEVSDKYLHEAQVVSAYYGFFTRNPDAAYLNFLERLDRGEITLSDLANAFINAQEYRQRFGQ